MFITHFINSNKGFHGEKRVSNLGRRGLLFYSPLTTVRNNLSITLEDTEGNEISHRGVQSMSVVEKGSWDEFLPLEGGGHVHMNLQFVLSEEERNRIRIMRESAMKKKSGDLLKSLETASTAGGIVSSSLRINHEVSVLRLLKIHKEVLPIMKRQALEI